MKNLLHSLLLPAALLLSGASAYIPERGPSQVAVVLAGSSSYIPARSTSPAAGTAPGPSPCGRGDASVAFRAPRSIPPTGLRPWVPPAHEAAGGHGPLGITPGLQDTLPLPCIIDIDTHYKSISISRNNLLINYIINYKRGQRLHLIISEENDSIFPIRQFQWETVFRDFNDKYHDNVVIQSNNATLEARLFQKDYSLLVPIIGCYANHLACDSSFYYISKGDKYDVFVDKGPLSLNGSNDSTILYRINIPSNWRSIDYSNYYNSVKIRYPRGQFIQISYQHLKKSSSFRGIDYYRITKEEGSHISSSVKKNPRKNDVAVYVEGALREGTVYITILAKRHNYAGILQILQD